MIRHRIAAIALLAAKVVVADVCRYPVQPRCERRFSPVAVRLPEQGDERVLSRVEGIVAVLEHAETDPEHTRLMTRDELVEGLEIAADVPFNEVDVDVAVGHR